MENEVEKQLENNVVLIGCINNTLKSSIVKKARDENAQIVMLEDKVVYDYLNLTGVGIKDVENKKLSDFLSNVTNQQIAQHQTGKLYTIITGSTDFSKSCNINFTEQDVCKHTNLSHRRANKVFDLLRAFGLFEWVDRKNRVFRLNFEKSCIYNGAENDVIAMTHVIKADIVRYQELIKSDDVMNNEQKEEKINSLKNNIRTLLSL